MDIRELQARMVLESYLTVLQMVQMHTEIVAALIVEGAIKSE